MPIAPEPLLTSLLVIMLGPSCFGDVVLKDLKPFKDYQELAQLLIDRGMDVPDETRAVRKLSQAGYYRLSGFWYACRTQDALFFKVYDSFDAVERKKIFMLACIIWYLVRSVGPSSDLFDRFMIELQSMPGLPCDGYEEMGVPKAFRSSFVSQV